MGYTKEITEKENMLLVINGDTPAWIPRYGTACAGGGYAGLGRKQDPATGYNVDIFGVKFTSTIDGPIPVNTKTRDFELKDITKWKEIIPAIDLKNYDWETEAATVLSRVKEGQIISFSAGSCWEELHYMMGFENALLSIGEEPEAVYDCLNGIIDFYIEALRRIFPYLKPEIVTLMDHIANALGLLMSPKSYRELIKPAQKKFYDAVLDLGAITQMHVDGLVEDVLPDYAEIGIKMIQPFQVFNDIEAAKKKYGFVCVGGWNAIGPGNQPNATEEEARASVRLAMDTYGPSGKYVFFESGATPRFPDILNWVVDEAETYGTNFYHNLKAQPET